MTPEQRARQWYPSAAWGGGNNKAVYDGVGGRFLWKPVSDSNGKAAVHTPAGVRISSLTVAGKTYGVGSIGNGYRPLFRLDKPGAAYGSQVPVQMNLHGGGVLTILVPNGGQRFEKSGFKDTDAAPATPPVQPSQPQPGPVGGSITFPASYASRVAFVAILGTKGEICQPDPRKAGRWTHKRVAAPADFYAIRWAVKPPAYVKSFDLGPLGLWSYFDDGDFRAWPNAQVPVAPLPPAPVPLPPAPTPEPLHIRTPNTLTLRADFAAVVKKVDALANVVEPGNPNPVFIQAVRSGNTWTIPKALSAYPKGNRPNTWRISLKGQPPAGVTYHASIMQTFLREGDANTYPPTTRV